MPKSLDLCNSDYFSPQRNRGRRIWCKGRGKHHECIATTIHQGTRVRELRWMNRPIWKLGSAPDRRTSCSFVNYESFLQAFAVEDLAALVEQGVWRAEELIDELNSLGRKNFPAYAPPRAEYALQGRSMELGLDAYVKMIAPGGGMNYRISV